MRVELSIRISINISIRNHTHKGQKKRTYCAANQNKIVSAFCVITISHVNHVHMIKCFLQMEQVTKDKAPLASSLNQIVQTINWNPMLFFLNGK